VILGTKGLGQSSLGDFNYIEEAPFILAGESEWFFTEVTAVMKVGMVGYAPNILALVIREQTSSYWVAFLIDVENNMVYGARYVNGNMTLGAGVSYALPIGVNFDVVVKIYAGVYQLRINDVLIHQFSDSSILTGKVGFLKSGLSLHVDYIKVENLEV